MLREQAIEFVLLVNQIDLEKTRKIGIFPTAAKKEPNVKTILCKIPAFNKKQYSIDAYLKKLERFAENS